VIPTSLLQLAQEADTLPVQAGEPVEGLYAISATLCGIIVLLSVGFGLLMVLMAVMPNLSARATAKFRTRHLFSFLIGLGAALPCFILTALGPGGAVLGLALFTPLFLLGQLSVSETLGRKVFFLASREGSRPLHVLVGWPLLTLASLTPVVGWFLIAPYALISGMGSVLIGLFSKEEEVL
jgi:hypothetical protein